MRKIAYLVAAFIILFGLSACNPQQDDTNTPQKTTSSGQKETKDPGTPAPPVQQEPNDHSTPTPPDEQGTTDQDTPAPPVQEEKVYQNKIFKEVVVTDSGDKIIVKGKAQVFEGVFQYVLYEGEKVLIQDHYQTAGAPAWGEFELSFDKKLVAAKNIKLELFVFSAKDGSKQNPLDIPISTP